MIEARHRRRSARDRLEASVMKEAVREVRRMKKAGLEWILDGNPLPDQSRKCRNLDCQDTSLDCGHRS